MERELKVELIQRSLGLRHKIKVHESMKTPESHEDMALTILARWELEDELRAIEEMLTEARNESVSLKRRALNRTGSNQHSTPVKKTKGSP